MASINMDSIMKKVVDYSKTPGGKAKMREVIQQYRADGVGKTGAGGKIITEKDMFAAASRLIDVLRSTAQSYDLPASVMRHFDSLECSKIKKMPDGSSVIYIYFEDDLHRESLYDDYYDEGAYNIVALLNHGYHAKDHVYGSWEGHRPTGEARFDATRTIDTSPWIKSKKDREGLYFIQRAIQDFNGNYGSEYNVTATVSEDYE